MPTSELFALKFLLHLIGDVHQPLHSADNDDRGGNEVKVIVDGFPYNTREKDNNLHHFWDTRFIEDIATRPATLAKKLRMNITPADARNWATRIRPRIGN